MPTKTLLCLALCLAASAARADEKSEKAAADLLHKRLQNERPQDKALLDAVKGREVVVVRGSMDHIEEVLRAARIPHTVIDPGQVAAAELTNSMVLMVNCPGVMPDGGLKRVERFVRAGGLLYTTDWALANVVQKAFPNTIAHNGASTGDEVVPVLVDEKADNLMSQMLLTKSDEPQWWLEGGSYPIKILDPKKVKVLAHSNVMGKRYGASPVVVRFPYEDGQVIHVVSHFVRQAATQGQKVAAKDANLEGLTEAQAKDFKANAAAGASLGDVSSSYAFQRMTTNLLVGKQRDNAELRKSYNLAPAAPVVLKAAPKPDSKGVGTSAAGTGMKVLERKDDQVKVRDEQGNEGWVDSQALKAR